jgi:hypothetical protein
LVPGEASLRERSDPDVAEVLGKIERYNHLFGGNTSGLIQACRFKCLSVFYIINCSLQLILP